MFKYNISVYLLVLLILGIAFVGTAAPQETTSADITISVNDSRNGADTTTLPITINESSTDNENLSNVPADPTQRVLQITGKQQASDLTQNDVTTVITLRSRGSAQNSVTVSQSDVTTVITLFARNN